MLICFFISFNVFLTLSDESKGKETAVLSVSSVRRGRRSGIWTAAASGSCCSPITLIHLIALWLLLQPWNRLSCYTILLGLPCSWSVLKEIPEIIVTWFFFFLKTLEKNVYGFSLFSSSGNHLKISTNCAIQKRRWS